MNIETLRHMLGWCAIINYAVLILWIALFFAAHDWFQKLHEKLFRLSAEQFNGLNYGGIIFFKTGILLFNLAPYLALRIVG
jgi:Family of unknown function (DUF6868)